MIPFDGYPGKAFAFFFGYSQPDISFNHGIETTFNATMTPPQSPLFIFIFTVG
jgi:hypothetical protein